VIRTLNWLYASRNDHLSTVVLKLIGNFCKYNTLRPYVLAALVALLTNNGEAVKTSVMGLSNHYNGSELLVANALNELILAMNQASSSLKSGIYRKLLATLSVLLRKTDQIVWYDIVNVDKNAAQSGWLFSSIIGMLSSVATFSTVDLDSSLQLVEKICVPFSKLSVVQVNALLLSSKLLNAGDINKAGGKEVYIPFPTLSKELGVALAGIVGVVDCSSIGRKSLNENSAISIFVRPKLETFVLLGELSTTCLALVNKTFFSFQ